MRKSIFVLLLLLALAAPGTDKRPLLAPVSGSPYITSSFGEYRYTHFHGGVDYSTGGEEGWPVLAVADGSVSRIKRESGGYGRALYLDLWDGRTVVYGHLIRFSRELGIEQRLKSECEKQQTSFPGDIFFDPPVPVKSGQVVAYSGQLGIGSPHLHLEVRRGDLLLDPFAEGIPAPKYSRPRIDSLYIVPRKAGATVNDSFLPFKAAFTAGAEGDYRLKDGVQIGGEADICIGVSDNMGSATYTTIPTSIKASVDGNEFFHMDLAEISLAHYKDSMHFFESFNGSGQLLLLRAKPELRISGVRGGGLPALSPGKHELEISVANRAGKSCVLRGSVLVGAGAEQTGEIEGRLLEITGAELLSTGICLKAVRSPGDGRSSVEVGGRPTAFFRSGNGTGRVELLIPSEAIGNNAEKIRSGESLLPGYFVRGPATASAGGFTLKVPSGVLARFNPDGGSVTVDAAPAGLRPLVQLSCAREGKAGALFCGNGEKFFFNYLGAKDKGIYKARKYAVLKDSAPPGWGKPLSARIRNLGEPELRISLKDGSSGIDPRSIAIYIDSKRVFPDWDSDASTVRVDILGLPKGEHTVSGSAKDRMGNKADLPLTKFFI